MTDTPLKNSRIAIFAYQRIWPIDCGFHSRCWQIIDGLQALGAQVHVVGFSGPRPAACDWSSDAHAYLASKNISLHLAPFHAGTIDFWMTASMHLIKAKVMDVPMLAPTSIYYVRPLLERRWRQVLAREKINGAIINYATWRRLALAARKKGIWTAIEMHELLTRQMAEREQLRGRVFSGNARVKFYNQEIGCLSSADVVIAINSEEQTALEKDVSCPIEYLPYCTPPVGRYTGKLVPSDILVVGSGIDNNKRGLQQFLSKAWPLIFEKEPATKLQICGKVGEGIAETGNISVISRAPDLTPYYQGAKVVLLTTVAGAGVKIKTIESFAHGSCIVAHEHSVLGTPFLGGYHGEAVADLADSGPLILDLLKHPEKREMYRSRTRELFETDYSVAKGREILARVFSKMRIR